MASTTYHPVRISAKSLDALKKWSGRHNGYSSCESSFRDMVTMAQKLTGTLRPTDSLDIIDDRRALKDFISGGSADQVVGTNFMSFLYRDSKGIEVKKADLLNVDAERPFDHADVFLLPRHQFEFLLIARQKAVIFGAEPQLTVHDVAEAIVDNLQNVSRDGVRFHYGEREFKIRRSQPQNA